MEYGLFLWSSSLSRGRWGGRFRGAEIVIKNIKNIVKKNRVLENVGWTVLIAQRLDEEMEMKSGESRRKADDSNYQLSSGMCHKFFSIINHFLYGSIYGAMLIPNSGSEL